MPTRFPAVEERLWPILDTMVEEAGFEPTGRLRQSWISGAREYADNVGTDAKIVRAAIHEMQKAGLTIASPRSLVTMALKLKGKWKRVNYGGCAECGQVGGHADDCPEA